MATKEIPYGLSDYARLALENYYYVDKTHFIPLIEKAASFFFLIREIVETGRTQPTSTAASPPTPS